MLQVDDFSGFCHFFLNKLFFQSINVEILNDGSIALLRRYFANFLGRHSLVLG